MRLGPFISRYADVGAKHRVRLYQCRIVLATVCGSVAAINPGGVAFGQVAQTLSGPPVQVQPYAAEPGIPLITIAPGTLNPFPTTDGSGTGGSGTGGVAGGGNVSGSDALNTMIGTTWGAAAVANAQALGVNPSALAATCVLESQCQNINNASGGSASGPFQMINSTYNAMIAAAAQDDPSLASSFSGKTDPATEAAAAAELLKVEAVQLQNVGIADPTFLDVRGGYAFGNGNTYAVASAPDSEPLGAILTSWTATQWQQNGLTPATTVGQWRQSITTKIGSAAGQSVLLGAS